MAVIACLSALWARYKSGNGQKVDVSMLDAILPLMTLQLAHYHGAGIAPGRGEAALSGGLACYGVYQCADEKYIALGMLEDKFWKNFCEMMERPDWLARQFVIGEEANKLRMEIAAVFKTKTRDKWITSAARYDTCLTPILEIEEIEKDPQIKARNMVIEQIHPGCGKIKSIGVPLKFSGTEAKPPAPAPALGKDTVAIMKEIGYSLREIESLKKEKIIYI
jgi:alpha-methylacyl-CoA racemase